MLILEGTELDTVNVTGAEVDTLNLNGTEVFSAGITMGNLVSWYTKGNYSTEASAAAEYIRAINPSPSGARIVFQYTGSNPAKVPNIPSPMYDQTKYDSWGKSRSRVSTFTASGTIMAQMRTSNEPRCVFACFGIGLNSADITTANLQSKGGYGGNAVTFNMPSGIEDGAIALLFLGTNGYSNGFTSTPTDFDLIRSQMLLLTGFDGGAYQGRAQLYSKTLSSSDSNATLTLPSVNVGQYSVYHDGTYMAYLVVVNPS